jgi:hypothetical protein
MVVEEKLMTKYKVPPMQAVGWEGFFGMIIMISISAILSATTEVGDPITENMKDAFIQLDPSKPNKSGGGLPIFLLFCGTICSIALFNFSGLSVTREMGAVYRMVRICSPTPSLLASPFSVEPRGRTLRDVRVIG